MLMLTGVAAYAYTVTRPQPEITQTQSPKNVTRTVTVGVFSSTDSNYPLYKFLSKLATRDFGDYCNRTGVAARLNVTLGNAAGQPQKALEFTQMCNKTGIKVIVGFGWSSYFCSGAYGYANKSGMILISPSSTSPTYDMRDHVFRLCSDDVTAPSRIMAKILIDRGVESIVLVRRGDSWADLFYNLFKSNYEGFGGSIISDVRYDPEATKFDKYMSNVSTVLEKEIESQSADKLAVFFIGYDETSDCLISAQKYASLLNVTWYGTEGSVNLPSVLMRATATAIKVRLIAPSLTKIDTESLTRITSLWLASEEYKKAGAPATLSFYDANIYDSIMVAALTLLQSNSTDTTTLEADLPAVAASYNGATGRVFLDDNGDRTGLNYDLWAYLNVNGENMASICGHYDAALDKITWNKFLIPP
jgi:branched-chain amino acid transport system substrate-binding protein